MSEPSKTRRRIALITGAAGGMGRACARLLGRRYRLALVDIGQESVDTLAASLVEEGLEIALAARCDIGVREEVAALARALGGAGDLGAVAHTAGLSPVLASWKPIIQVNLVGTALLYEALDPLVGDGTAVVSIASMAAHIAPKDPAIDAVIDHPLAPDLIARLEPILADLVAQGAPEGGAAYCLSKRGVVRLSERQAAAWGPRNARVTTISPGMIWTPMGRKETEEGDPAGAQHLFENTPLRRWGTPYDIANAVDFLTSDLASFITGSDLKVDGGAIAVTLGGATL
jgi:NAD(P)-dependent dehydrogenase (short-subunit alcohol dehydrogenase family)